MDRFARRTGLTGGAQRRYLWTDAFAICNFLALARATGEAEWLGLARRLVHDVHHVLGRHRPDDVRTGWISGLSEDEGERHPTAGGLRIGKKLPERAPDATYDDRLEWDRDGQYFHYLTKWMQALDQMARATGEADFARQAHELARRAHDAFAWRPRDGARNRLYWKCSIDLSRPLVPSMGQHDALDGFVTCVQLDASACVAADLGDVARDFATMLPGVSLATGDPLGIGGVLADAWRVHQLARAGALADDARLVEILLASAAAGLEAYAGERAEDAPAARRLAFRELGLAIGLAAVTRLRADPATHREALTPWLTRLASFADLGERIVRFWSEPAHRTNDTWREHEDIDDVMLATALLPGGFLDLAPPHTAANA